MNRDVIIALDFQNAEETFAFLDRFEEKPFVKIGMELFYAEGPNVVKRAVDRGHKVFLDLKLHDIPNTVKRAMSVIANLGVEMVNLHASGTVEMMRAARDGLIEGARKEPPLLIAVTLLTSTGETSMREELLIEKSMPEVVAHYAKNARTAGLDGVVCSPLEAGAVKAACGADFLTVTPGVRFEESTKDDQKRVMTPAKAKAAGSDFIVVGRPITRADDPVAAYQRCMKEFAEG